MRLLTIPFAALVFGQSACAANAELDAKEMLRWEATATACGHVYQRYVADGLGSLVAGLEAEILQKARQSGASQAQVEEIEGFYLGGRKFAAVRGWTRQRVFERGPGVFDDYIKREAERQVSDVRRLCVEEAPRSDVLQRTHWAVTE